MSILPNRRLLRAIILAGVLVPITVFGQVKIRERAEISPRRINPPHQTAAGDSTFQVRIDWDINYPDPGQVTLGIDYDYTCQNFPISVIEQGQEHRVYSFSYTPNGLYVIYVWHYGWPDSVHVTMTVSKVSEPEQTFFFTIGPYDGVGGPPGASFHFGDWNWGGIPFTTPFCRWFELRVENEVILPSDQNSFWISGRSDTCTGISWYPSVDPITYTITSGNEFGGFVGGANGSLAQTLTILGPPTYQANPGRAGGPVTVTAVCKSIVSTKTFQVLPFLGKTLRLATKSPIAINQFSVLAAEVLDSSGAVVPMPHDITFNYKIVSGTSWGVLYDDNSGRQDSVMDGVGGLLTFYPIDTARIR